MTRRKPPIAEPDKLRPPPRRETDDQKVDRVKRRVEAATVVLESDVFLQVPDKIGTREAAAVASSMVDDIYKLTPTLKHGKSAQKGRSLGGQQRAALYQQRDELIRHWATRRASVAAGRPATEVARSIIRFDIPAKVAELRANADDPLAKILHELKVEGISKIVRRVLSTQE